MLPPLQSNISKSSIQSILPETHSFTAQCLSQHSLHQQLVYGNTSLGSGQQQISQGPSQSDDAALHQSPFLNSPPGLSNTTGQTPSVSTPLQSLLTTDQTLQTTPQPPLFSQGQTPHHTFFTTGQALHHSSSCTTCQTPQHQSLFTPDQAPQQSTQHQSLFTPDRAPQQSTQQLSLSTQGQAQQKSTQQLSLSTQSQAQQQCTQQQSLLTQG
ncbi:hypothetical protein DPMN_114247 [Dreissena polymorpha]|uniref:Uncharacterized protein n=1 Tax=Dreissena polymorpha TaxID=45954 RepID=A0A9D4KKI3_DREPO|nr:hypothetical protein DPMN_114247 [Dreissena polymorpha]